MKIVFMGTPEFAVGALEALIRAGHEVTAVVTQPDKAKGRSRELQPPPIKECAVRHGIPVMQPRRIKTPEAVEQLRMYPADVFIVAAFGQILSREILDLPRYGCLNIHASLLPRYRGSSPIQHAIIDGLETTGVTIQQMDEGIDTGDILYSTEVPIGSRDTYSTLQDKLMEAGSEAVVKTLALLERGELQPRKQDDAASSHAPMIDKTMGRIDFTGDAAAIERLIRGLNPWPSAYTFYKGKQLKIWEAEAEEGGGSDAAPGTVLEIAGDSVLIAAGQGSLRVYSLQLEGKKRMSAHDFLLGVRMQAGEALG